MGKKSFSQVLEQFLEGLDILHDNVFSIPDIISASGLNRDTVQKLLDMFLKIQNRGYLIKVKDKPQMYLWVPNRDLMEILAVKFFQILLIKESLTAEELEEEYGLSYENAIKIMKILVEKKLARWAAQDTIALYPIDHYLKREEEINNELQNKKKLVEIKEKA